MGSFTTAEDIKNISIKSFLEQNSIRPARDGGTYGLYRAPYRKDESPSMKVSYQSNSWYDFATGEHGDIIDLVRKINNIDFKSAVQVLKRRSGLTIHQLAPVQADSAKPEARITVFKAMELRNPALLQYLQERCIDLAIAKKMCKEVYYEVRMGEKSKRYFGIGFQNNRGGWEIRSKYFKGCTSKDISTTNRSSTTCRVFEGFMDYLSFLTLDKQGYTSPEWYGNNNENVVVLNSTAILNRAKDFLSQHTVNICYLDNDSSGKSTLQAIKNMGLNAVNASNIYKDHKDLNEFHQSLPLKKEQAQEKKQSKGVKI